VYCTAGVSTDAGADELAEIPTDAFFFFFFITLKPRDE